MKEMEQRMKIVKPKLQALEHIKDTTGQIEYYELAQELFKLQNYKNRLAIGLP